VCCQLPAKDNAGQANYEAKTKSLLNYPFVLTTVLCRSPLFFMAKNVAIALLQIRGGFLKPLSIRKC
jgi:hypothetical protein